ncbi:MAG: PKD domain-containing protein [Bacteroidia bacterium]|nr:PKD domain-containing protein [Bacteroidia bacterium]
MNSFANWQGRTGSCCPINLPTAGIVAGRHTIMTGAGTDPVTGGGLPVVCPGYAFSARLGNNGTGAQAEGLSYSINVATDSSNALFLYSYAVVLEDPGHTPAQQPRFELQVRDGFGNIIPCTFYQVAAAAGIPGFQSFGGVRWKPWEQVGVDLSPFIGQTVTIEARTGDCSQSGHFGYAYIVAECRPMKLDVTYCRGANSANVAAPPGFASYQWSTGATSQQINIPNPIPNQIVSCTLTSASGCLAYLEARINQTEITPQFAATSDCNGQVTFTDLSTVINGSNVAWTWDFGDGTSASAQSPIHTYPAGGNYNVEIVVESNQGCRDSITQQIYVRQSPVAAFNTPNVCSFDRTFNNTSVANNTFTSFAWTFGNGASSTAQNPQYTYADPSVSGLGWNYNVQLIVENQDNCFDTATQNITLWDIPVAGYNFTANCDQSVQFTNTSTIDDGTALSYDWDFGDGNGATAASPTPVYGAGGDYVVELIVSSATGCADTIQQNVHVRQSPVASFTAPSACGFDRVFTNTSAANTNFNSFAWDFGNGASASTQNVNYTYPDPSVSGLGWNYNVQLIVENQDNCFDTAIQAITLWDIPVAAYNFTANCDQSVQFANTSTIDDGTALSYDWDFGDGNGATAASPTPVYAAGGDYTVELIATSATGCADTVSQSVHVRQSPLASFTAPSVCGYDRVFTNTSVANTSFNSFAWDFGDGNSATTANASYTYGDPVTTGLGWNYTVQLIVENQDNCFDTASQNIVLWDIPVAAFQIPVQACVNEQVLYNDGSSVNNANITNWDWDFGDGNGDAVASPVHGYAAAGTYTVELIVTDNNGCADTTSQTIPVFNNPVAQFPIPAACGINVQFMDSSLTNGGSAIQTWGWTFGDGNGSPVQNPLHTYGNTGVFNVGLGVTNADGCSDSIEQAVTVHELPVAGFTFNPVCRYQTVSFTNTSTTALDPITVNNWSMHDGTTYGTASTTHPYNTDGSFPVTLIVTTAFGCSDTVTQNVTIHPLPQPDFSAAAVCQNNFTVFQNNSSITSGSINAWEWQFGAAIPNSTSQTPQVIYPNYGTYNVWLVATSNFGCEDSIMHAVTVHPNPSASFTIDQMSGCSPLAVQFTTTSTIVAGNIVDYDWDLGADFSSDPNPGIIYGAGTYPITLIVTTDMGCKDTATSVGSIVAFPTPVAHFDNNPGKAPLSSPFFQFTNMSDGYTGSQWYFGDGNGSTATHPGHLYQPEGATEYDVTLVVSNQYGCLDSTQERVYIYGDHIIYIPNTATVNNDGINESFLITGIGIVDAELLVFDRWGEKVGHVKGWQTDRLTWNCTDRSGNSLKQDTYSYKLFYKAESGKTYDRMGHVNILH